MVKEKLLRNSESITRARGREQRWLGIKYANLLIALGPTKDPKSHHSCCQQPRASGPSASLPCPTLGLHTRPGLVCSCRHGSARTPAFLLLCEALYLTCTAAPTLGSQLHLSSE